MIFRYENKHIIINKQELLQKGRDFLTHEEMWILDTLLHKLKCRQEWENEREIQKVNESE